MATALLISVSHTAEFMIHWARGTPNLAASMAASCAFTAVPTQFNLHAMRRGVLITGREGHNLLTDLRMLPSVVTSMLPSIPRQWKKVRAWQ